LEQITAAAAWRCAHQRLLDYERALLAAYTGKRFSDAILEEWSALRRHEISCRLLRDALA
jgi:hypothetical protein